MKAELFRQAAHELAEGPVWHEGCLWWVDLEVGSLHNSEGQSYHAPHSIGAALPCTSGCWLLAEEGGFSFWHLRGGAPQRFWTRPERSPKYRFNDAKVAPDGTVVAGSLQRGTLEGDCSYYELSESLKVVKVRGGVGLCNGIDWDVARDCIYFTDTGAQAIYRCPTGQWDEAGVFASFEEGYPDGLCVDAEGNVWVALWGAGRVVCIEGSGERILHRVEVPVPNVSSCCFGGADMDTLYITTAREGMSLEQLGESPLSGSIFACQTIQRGVPTRVFNDTGK